MVVRTKVNIKFSVKRNVKLKIGVVRKRRTWWFLPMWTRVWSLPIPLVQIYTKEREGMFAQMWTDAKYHFLWTQPCLVVYVSWYAIYVYIVHYFVKAKQQQSCWRPSNPFKDWLWFCINSLKLTDWLIHHDILNNVENLLWWFSIKKIVGRAWKIHCINGA